MSGKLQLLLDIKFLIFFHCPKPSYYIASVTAIFPFCIPIHRKRLATGRTDEFINRLSFHLIQMRIPPLIPTFIGTEPLFLLSFFLFNALATVLASRLLQTLRDLAHSFPQSSSSLLAVSHLQQVPLGVHSVSLSRLYSAYSPKASL